LSRSISASGATLFGFCPVLPGKAVAVSMIEPVFTVWWFRPVFSALRVGEQSAVVWKLLKRRPVSARRSMVGVRIGPPNVLGPPNPTSSIRTMTTFGAFAAL
jgi:hypothetical protein